MASERVLLLNHHLSLTGAPKVALDIFDGIVPRMQISSVASQGGPLAGRFRRLGPVVLLSDLPSGRNALVRAYRRVARSRWSASLRKWQPDIIYVNTTAALSLAHVIELPSAPLLLHVHELGAQLAAYSDPFRELFLERPERYIAVSDAVRRSLMADYSVPGGKISVIHPAVPTRDYRPRESLPEHSDTECLVVGGAGLPAWRKGTSLWVLMAYELRKIMGAGNVRFVWVGAAENQNSSQFRQMAHKLNLDSDVEFVPITPEPLKHFERFHIFAMTSWTDACPLVVLENMMLKKPVVCFAHGGGAPEAVGDAGIVIEDFSPRAMAEAIAQLAESPERMATLGQAAHERVMENFVASVQAPKIRREIYALLKRTGDPV